MIYIKQEEICIQNSRLKVIHKIKDNNLKIHKLKKRKGKN